MERSRDETHPAMATDGQLSRRVLDDGTPETTRIRPMSASDAPRRRHRKPSSRTDVIIYIALLLILTTIILIAALRLSGKPSTPAPRTTPTTITVTHPPTPTKTPKPSRTSLKDPQVAAALKIKPLEDLQKGDRVIYQNHPCIWLAWNKNITTSTIRCTGDSFQIQTGRLTPVEKKTKPSTLKVKH